MTTVNNPKWLESSASFDVQSLTDLQQLERVGDEIKSFGSGGDVTRRIIRVGGAWDIQDPDAALVAAAALTPTVAAPVDIVLESGFYDVNRAAGIARQPFVNLRSESGNPNDVVIFNSNVTGKNTFIYSTPDGAFQDNVTYFGQTGAAGEAVRVTAGGALFRNWTGGCRFISCTTGVRVTGGIAWIVNGEFQLCTNNVQADAGTTALVWNVFAIGGLWIEVGTGRVRRWHGTNDPAGIPHMEMDGGYILHVPRVNQTDSSVQWDIADLTIVRWTTFAVAANATIDGLLAKLEGRQIYIYNDDPTFNITLVHNSGAGGVLPADQIIFASGANLVLTPGQISGPITYVDSKWRSAQ